MSAMIGASLAVVVAAERGLAAHPALRRELLVSGWMQKLRGICGRVSLTGQAGAFYGTRFHDNRKRKLASRRGRHRP